MGLAPPQRSRPVATLPKTTAAEKQAWARFKIGRPTRSSQWTASALMATSIAPDAAPTRRPDDVERHGRSGQPGQDSGETEQPDGDRRQPWSDTVDHDAGRAHRDERADADEEQRQSELRIGRPRAALNGGQRRSPGAPEDPKCREAEKDAVLSSLEPHAVTIAYRCAGRRRTGSQRRPRGFGSGSRSPARSSSRTSSTGRLCSRCRRLEGELWFKAVSPINAFEPRLTALLARLQPGRVPDVIAVDTDRAWMLMARRRHPPSGSAGERRALGARPLRLRRAPDRRRAAPRRAARLGVPDIRLDPLPA